MSTILEQILDSFYTELARSKAVDSAAVDALRALLVPGNKVKADDLVAIFSKPSKASQS